MNYRFVRDGPKRAVQALLVALLLLSATPGLTVGAQTPSWPGGCTEEWIPGWEGEQQLVRVCLPDTPTAWNGYLILYAHGYVSPQQPLALPDDELGRVALPDGRTIVQAFVDLGFAFATTSYSKNGYAVEQAEDDLNALVDHVKDTIAPLTPAKILLAGSSEGAIIVTQMLERHPDSYDGALAMCGPLAGMPYQIQYAGDFRVVYDYFFPDVFPFGALDVPEDAYLNWPSYQQQIEAALLSQPLKAWQLFRVTKAPWQPGDGRCSAPEAAKSILAYNIYGTNDLRETAGGNPYGNNGTVYRGSWRDWWLNARVERMAADPAAVAYVQEYYQTTGKLHDPLVTLHTVLDPDVPFRHEIIYADLVQQAGAADHLVVLPAFRCGHCNFEAVEVLGALATLLIKAGGVPSAELEAYRTQAPRRFKLDDLRQLELEELRQGELEDLRSYRPEKLAE